VATGAPEYFAVLDDDNRRGPFHSMGEAGGFLRHVSRYLGHTNEQAHHFFAHESAIEQVETLDGREQRVRVGWLEREKTGRLDVLA
jgi:hypothetical protein